LLISGTESFYEGLLKHAESLADLMTWSAQHAAVDLDVPYFGLDFVVARGATIDGSGMLKHLDPDEPKLPPPR
jgi:hypothetical protein